MKPIVLLFFSLSECRVRLLLEQAEQAMFDRSNFKTRSFGILSIVRDFFKQPTGERDIANVGEIHIITNARDQSLRIEKQNDRYFKVRKCLSDVKPFSRLPPSLQNQILQEAWYECYSKQRTILRQGSRPACFYIILSGRAIVTYKRLTDGHVETLDILDRGCTFGEKGLLSNSLQKFTITSKTEVELLVLWKDDFKAIYMSDDRYCNKDDLKFLKNHVSFLRGFPIDRLNEFPHAIQHCSFGQAEVVARDSRRMKCIFVVKKGSMAVWKRLDPDGHIPKLNNHEFEQTDDEKMVDNDDDDGEATADDRTLFSEIELSGGVGEKTSNSSNLLTDFSFSRLRRSTLVDRQLSTQLSENTEDIEKKFPGIFDKRDRLQLIDYENLSINKSDDPPLVNDAPKHQQSIINVGSNIILPKQMIYVHVKTLNEGQYFGLADMLFPNQPALTLISNECECLLLRKSSFVRIASDQYKQNIRRTEIPFPDDFVFYRSYHTNEVWKLYSKEIYKNACQRMKQQHPQTVKRSSSTVSPKKKQSFDLLLSKFL